MACVDVALGAVGSADLVVTNDGADETALGEVLTDANVRTAALADTPLGGVGSADEVQVAETAGDCLGPGPIPEECDPAWASCYRITDLSGVYGCAACDASSDTSWDGDYPVRLGNCPTEEAWLPPQDARSIDGKLLYASSAIYFQGVTLGSYYLLQIICDGAGGTDDIWYGYKYDGSSPAGVYTFDYSGCGNTGPATLTVEECPA
jgi:hypothetical protein